MMKKILGWMIFGTIIVTLHSCKKKVQAEPELHKTSWISEDGTKTLEFGKK